MSILFINLNSATEFRMNCGCAECKLVVNNKYGRRKDSCIMADNNKRKRPIYSFKADKTFSRKKKRTITCQDCKAELLQGSLTRHYQRFHPEATVPTLPSNQVNAMNYLICAYGVMLSTTDWKIITSFQVDNIYEKMCVVQ